MLFDRCVSATQEQGAALDVCKMARGDAPIGFWVVSTVRNRGIKFKVLVFSGVHLPAGNRVKSIEQSMVSWKRIHHLAKPSVAFNMNVMDWPYVL